MQEQKDQPPTDNAAKNKHTDFFEKKEMNAGITDADNTGDESFTPIYLDDDNVLQTPEEKKHDESMDAQKGDKVEAMNLDDETTIDKINDNAQSRGTNQ